MTNAFGEWSSTLRTVVLAACSGALLGGCTNFVDPAADEFPEAESVDQAYSDAECQTASADATVNVAGTQFNIVRNTPSTYGNPNAFKSYLWDFRRSDFNISSAFPSVGLNPSSAAIHDTQAECEGLSLRRRVYENGTLLGSATRRGVWDVDYGCQLPVVYGALITSFASGDVVRVCATARDRNQNVVPMWSWFYFEEPLPPVFNNPQIRKGASWYPIAASAPSALAYCIRRGYSSVFSSSAGACTKALVQWSEFLHDWQVVALPAGQCRTVWASVSCE